MGSYLFLWQMFSNIKMKYLVFYAKPVEDKFLASTMRQNSIHLQFFIIASVLLQNCLFLIKSSQIQHAYLCGTHIFERIKYPELTHKHVQQLLTLSVHPIEQNSLYIFFPIYSSGWKRHQHSKYIDTLLHYQGRFQSLIKGFRMVSHTLD